MAREVVLHSIFKPVPIAHCLKDEMTRSWTAEEKRDGRVIGSGTERDMRLRIAWKGKRKRISIQLKAKFEEQETGTKIIGKFGLPPGVFWVAVIAAGIFAFNAAGLLTDSGEEWQFVDLFAAAIPMILIGSIVAWLGSGLIN